MKSLPGFIMEFPKEDIKAGDLNRFMVIREDLLYLTQKHGAMAFVEINISGYDDDPHPLWAISEVRAWYEAINSRWPDWLMSLTPGSLWVAFLCLDPQMDDRSESGASTLSLDLDTITERAFASMEAMKLVLSSLGIAKDDIDQILMPSLENVRDAYGGFRMGDYVVLHPERGEIVSYVVEDPDSSEAEGTKPPAPQKSEAGTHIDQASDLIERKSFSEARRLLSRTLTDLPSDAIELRGTALSMLASTYKGEGEFDQAEAALEQYIALAREVKAEHPTMLPAALIDLADLCEEETLFKRAIVLREEAFELDRRFLDDENHPYLAWSQLRLGELLEKNGEASAADHWYIDAIMTYMRAGEYEEAINAANQFAVALFRAKSPKRVTHLLEGVLHLIKTLDLENAVLDQARGNLSNLHNTLGYAYRLTGQYESAIVTYEDGLKVIGETGLKECEEAAVLLNNLGEAYRLMGLYPKALLLILDAKKVAEKCFGKEHKSYANTLYSLSKIYFSMGLYDEALETAKEELVLTRALNEEGHQAVSESYANLGAIRQKLGKFVEAGDDLKKALAIERMHGLADRPEQAMLHYNLGHNAFATGNFDEAEGYFRVAMDLAGERGPLRSAFIMSALGLGYLYVRTKRYDEAIAITQLAVDGSRESLWRSMSISTDRQRIELLGQHHFAIEVLLSMVVEFRSGSPNNVREAFKRVLQHKGLALEAHARVRKVAAKGDAELTPAIVELRSFQKNQSAVLLRPEDNDKPRGGDELVPALVRDLEEEAIVRQMGAADVWRDAPEVDFESVAQALPKNAALVEFVRFAPYDFTEDLMLPLRERERQSWLPERYLAFVLVDGDSDVRLLNLGDAAEIDDLIASFRARYSGGGRDLGSKEAEDHYGEEDGITLYEKLFEPLPLGERTRVLFAPDGEIAQLPFEALPVNDEYLLNRFQFSYLTSGRELIPQQKDAHSTAPPLVIGDPDYDLEAVGPTRPRQLVEEPTMRFRYHGLRFGRLGHTREEADSVARLLGVKALVEDAALEQTLKRYERPALLHIATHGFFLSGECTESNSSESYGLFGLLSRRTDNPLLRSALALAGANTWLAGHQPPEAAEDGLLTAQDVTGLNLDGTELVVLSACDTGLGDIHAGEGVLGLRRAFLIAGAQTLIMSLWKVPDRETKEIMIEFYTRLLSGMGRADALHQAQLEIQKKHPDNPWYWGAFICHGVTAPLNLVTSVTSSTNI